MKKIQYISPKLPIYSSPISKYSFSTIRFFDHNLIYFPPEPFHIKPPNIWTLTNTDLVYTWQCSVWWKIMCDSIGIASESSYRSFLAYGFSLQNQTLSVKTRHFFHKCSNHSFAVYWFKWYISSSWHIKHQNMKISIANTYLFEWSK